MERQKRSMYEVIAEMTGKDPTEVETQINQSLHKLSDSKSMKPVIISESFPCYLSLKEEHYVM